VLSDCCLKLLQLLLLAPPASRCQRPPPLASCLLPASLLLLLLLQVALWTVVRSATTKQQLVLPLALFGTHLALGNLWNWTFFGQRKMKESLPVMGAFWATIAGGFLLQAWHAWHSMYDTSQGHAPWPHCKHHSFIHGMHTVYQ
jgi:hypothetical protein